jgi:hypothetical protein
MTIAALQILQHALAVELRDGERSLLIHEA